VTVAAKARVMTTIIDKKGRRKREALQGAIFLRENSHQNPSNNLENIGL
jgi:hypothetical protein